MDYHRAIGRVRGLDPGSPSQQEQLMNMLERTPDLHTRDGTHDFESSHADGAIDNFIVRIRQHNEGPPSEATCCPESLVDRAPRSWGLMHDKGDALFGRDSYHDRYVVGSLRLATATGSGVMASPHNYVPCTEDEFGCDLNVHYGNDDATFAEGDVVAYLIKMVTGANGKRYGQAWTFGGTGGGSSGLRVATSTAKWVDGSPPSVACTDNETGDPITVLLPRTMPGDPNVRSGATVVYGRANDGSFYCVTDYMDDKIGTLKPNIITNDEFVPGWVYYVAGAGRVYPNFKEADPLYSPLLNEFGNISHDHDPHELDLQVSTINVLTSIDDTDPCALLYCYQQICFVGTANAEVC
jgi:hypothetical protein